MIAVVIGINLLIACAGFYLAWRLWHFQRRVSQTADQLGLLSIETHRTLNALPPSERILAFRQQVVYWQQVYCTWLRLAQQVQQVRSLLHWGHLGWRQWQRHRGTKRLAQPLDLSPEISGQSSPRQPSHRPGHGQSNGQQHR